MGQTTQERLEQLWWALRTRVLTDAEMEEVRREGIRITQTLIPTSGNNSIARYATCEEFNAALFNQARLQLLAAKGEPVFPDGSDAPIR
jgi:hypothetical protein